MKKITSEKIRAATQPRLEKIRAGKSRMLSWKADLVEKHAHKDLQQDPSFSRLDKIWAGPIGSGIRRTAKTGLHLAGWTLVNAAGGIALGQAPLPALISGGALAAGESMISLGISKARKEKATAEGKEHFEFVDWLLWVVYSLLNAWVRRRRSKK